MHPKERLQTTCGSVVTNHEKSPDQQILEEKGEILSCGGVYLPPAETPSPLKEPSYQFLFLPNFRQGVIMYRNLEAQCSNDPEITLQDPTLREAGTSHEALRRFFKEGLN